MPSDRCYTVRTLAAYLQVSNKTIYRMAADGELPAFKLRGKWRFRPADINRWTASLRRQETEGGHEDGNQENADPGTQEGSQGNHAPNGADETHATPEEPARPSGSGDAGVEEPAPVAGA